MTICMRVVSLRLMYTVSSSPIQVGCHPFFIRVVAVIGIKVTFSRAFICGDQPGGSRESRELTSVRGGIFFRISVFFRVVIGEPIFSCSTELELELVRCVVEGLN